MIDSMFGFDDSFIHACVLYILPDSTLKEHIDEQAITTVGAQVDLIAQNIAQKFLPIYGFKIQNKHLALFDSLTVPTISKISKLF